MRAWPINAEWGEAQRMTCLNRTGRHLQTARANVVIWAEDASDTLLTPRASC